MRRRIAICAQTLKPMRRSAVFTRVRNLGVFTPALRKGSISVEQVRSQPLATAVKIATFNVNGITARLPVLLRWLKKSWPDVACLQELKAPDAIAAIRRCAANFWIKL